jgi:hypothetical protein
MKSQRPFLPFALWQDSQKKPGIPGFWCKNRPRFLGQQQRLPQSMTVEPTPLATSSDHSY